MATEIHLLKTHLQSAVNYYCRNKRNVDGVVHHPKYILDYLYLASIKKDLKLEGASLSDLQEKITFTLQLKQRTPFTFTRPVIRTNFTFEALQSREKTQEQIRERHGSFDFSALSLPTHNV